MNAKQFLILSGMFLVVCAGWVWADTYHYPDRIEIDGDPVMVSGSPWTTSQNASGNPLTDLSFWSIVSGATKVKVNTTGLYVDGGDGYEKVTFGSEDVVVCRSTGAVDLIIKTFTCDVVCSDSDCGDDINEIQEEGLHMFLSGGTYPVSTIIDILNHSVFDGDGLLQETNGANLEAVLRLNGSENVTIRGIKIDGNMHEQSTSVGFLGGILLRGVRNVDIDDVEIYNTYSSPIHANHGVNTQGTWNVKVRNSYIHDSNGDSLIEFQQLGRYIDVYHNTLQGGAGVFFDDNIRYSSITNNIINCSHGGSTLNGADYSDHGIQLYNSYYVGIHDNVIVDCKIGKDYDGGTGIFFNSVSGCTVSGNDIIGNDGSGILLYNANSNDISDNLLHNNCMNDSAIYQAEIFLHAGTSTIDNNINGNTISETGGQKCSAAINETFTAKAYRNTFKDNEITYITPKYIINTTYSYCDNYEYDVQPLCVADTVNKFRERSIIYDDGSVDKICLCTGGSWSCSLSENGGTITGRLDIVQTTDDYAYSVTQSGNSSVVRTVYTGTGLPEAGNQYSAHYHEVSSGANARAVTYLQYANQWTMYLISYATSAPVINIADVPSNKAIAVYINDKYCFDGDTCSIWLRYNGTCLESSSGNCV